MALSAMPSRLHEFDLVVSCTASALPLIGLGAVERALVQRRRRPVLMVDLAVPRDIEPEVARLSDVYLYTVDDLASIVREGASSRQAAIEQAESIVDEGVRGFEHWMAQRRSVPLIQALQQRAEHWAEIEMRRARRRLARGQDVEAVLQALTRGLTGKLMHGALHEIHASDEAQRRSTAETMSRLFGLPALSVAASSPAACPHSAAPTASHSSSPKPPQEAP
jgi:glutamyl-tRNA reductase